MVTICGFLGQDLILSRYSVEAYYVALRSSAWISWIFYLLKTIIWYAYVIASTFYKYSDTRIIVTGSIHVVPLAVSSIVRLRKSLANGMKIKLKPGGDICTP